MSCSACRFVVLSEVLLCKRPFANSRFLDEVRRSGRATKGQNPKNHDDGPEVPTPKQRGKGSRSKVARKASPSPPPEDEDAIIRCICGCVEEDEDDERMMIICDNCDAWQHNECMEISQNPKELPARYYCEQCRPADHRELLAKVTRGEKPWEEIAKQREREEEERKARKRKGGRKGKKGRPSGVKGGIETGLKNEDVEINGTPAASPTRKADYTPAASPTRKADSTPAASPTRKADSTPAKRVDPTTSTKAESTPAKNVAPTQPPAQLLPKTPPPAQKQAVTPVAAPISTPATSYLREKNVQLQTLTPTAIAPATSPPTSEVQVETRVEHGQKRKLPREISTESKDTDQHVGEPRKSSLLYLLISQQEPSNKVRKLSTPLEMKSPVSSARRKKSGVAASASKRDVKGAVLQTELVENISDLQSDSRRRIAEALVKLFVEQTEIAQKEGTFKLPAGQTPHAFGLKLGLAVEYAVYLNFWGQSGQPSNLYGDKFRMILHNVKANTALRDRLLNGSLPPNEFSKMTSFDMASKELQEKTAEMKKEAEKQHMLVQEEGPRIRRTHKGEELVGDEASTAAVADQVYSQPIIRRREADFDMRGPKQASPEASSPHSPAAVELPENIIFPVNASSPATVQPLAVDTKAPPRAFTGHERKSSTAFNIQDVWSSVAGSDGDIQRPRLPESGEGPVQHPAAAVEADADIDHLLKDEEPEDEEPYSPTDFTADPGSSVWRGKMNMAGVAAFAGVAKHVAGANLSSAFPWAQLIPTNLAIEGRIDIERASEYLCGLRWSQTTDVSVVAVTPIDDPDARVQFDKLFKYFTERKRYGVIGKNPVAAVKDTYLVPLEAGISKKPDFVELLEYCTIEDPSPERMLLLTFVVKTNNSPSAQATPRNNPDVSYIASPITGGTAQTPTPFPALGNPIPHASPTQPYAGHSLSSLANTPSQPQEHAFMPLQQSHYTPQTPQTPIQPQQKYHVGPPKGIEAAHQVLGELATAPSVVSLLSEAPSTGVTEFEIIRDVLERVPATRNNFAMLKGMLAMEHQQSGGGV